NGELRNWVRRRYNDTKNEWLGKLKFIQVYIRTYRNRSNPTLARVNKLDVYKLSQATVDQTPYIIYPGDVVEFDHVTKDIRLNGESRKDLKAFGGSFFTLKKGVNTLTVMPENTFDVSIKYRDK